MEASTTTPTTTFSQQILRQPWYYKLALIILGLLTLLSAARTITNTIDPYGGIDFHAYWYNGHFVHQGTDPYWAFMRRWEPEVPVSYLGGEINQDGPIAQTGLGRTPANTAPMVLLLSLFAYLSWVPAKVIWLIINLLAMLAIPWLLVRLLPPNTVNPPFFLLINLAFFAFSSTRVAAWTGQTTLLIILLMLGAMLTMKRRWLLSGILLGLALSKYSLSLPVLMIALYKRKFRIVGVSLLIQLLGILYFVLMTESSVMQIIRAYIVVFRRLSVIPGIHFASLFGDYSLIGHIAAIIGTIIVADYLLKTLDLLQKSRADTENATVNVTPRLETWVDYHLFVITTLWILLIAYHRLYDSAILIAFITLGTVAIVHPTLWSLQRRGRIVVGATIALALGMQLLPGEIMGRFLPADMVPLWLKLVDNAITLSLVAALLLSTWLLRQMIRSTSRNDLPAKQMA